MDLGTRLYCLGVTPNYKSYHMTVAAVSLAEESPEYLHLVTKLLYPTVAKQYKTTWQAVERNIRSAAERAWSGGAARFEELTGRRLEKKPTASQFIEILAACDAADGV